MTESGTVAIEVQGLRKAFGEVVALDGLDLQVEAGPSVRTAGAQRGW